MIRSTLAIAALLGLALAHTATAQVRTPPSDTGNMAYPAPLPQGNSNPTPTGGGVADTGSTQYPKPAAEGNLATTTTGVNRPTDTGNMAFPAPLPQGNVAGSSAPK